MSTRAILEAPETDVTALLFEWSRGESGALDRLMPHVYGELKRIAERHMRRERPDHTLEPTALVHEAYCRLVDQRSARWESRTHFYAVAAQLMRRVLVDHARRRRFAKRAGSLKTISLDAVGPLGRERPADLVALDDALSALAQVDERKARVVELRIFGGLTIPETARVLGISKGTVISDYQTARAWLFRELDRAAASEVAAAGTPHPENG